MVGAAERERALERIRELCLAIAGIADDAYAEVAPAGLVEAARREEGAARS